MHTYLYGILFYIASILAPQLVVANDIQLQGTSVLSSYPSNPKFLDQSQSGSKNILCIDVGNTNVKLGFFDKADHWCVLTFPSSAACLVESWINAFEDIRKNYRRSASAFEAVRVSSVKPEINMVLAQAVQSVFQQEAFFLDYKNAFPLKLLIDDPSILGADIIAASLAVRHYFPMHTVLISFFGTATVVSAVNIQNEFLGASIMPGVDLSFQALNQNTSQLGRCTAVKPEVLLGKNAQSAIQSGVYYMQLGGVSFIINQFQQQHAQLTSPLMKIASGGHAQLFADELLFDAIIPDLVVQGLLWVNLSQAR